VVHIIIKGIGSIKERENWIIKSSNLDILDNNAFAIVTKLIKEGGKRLCLQIRNSIEPILIIVKIVVKNARVPIEVTHLENMRESLPFFVSIGAHSDVGKTTHNVERVSIAVKSSNALFAARNLDRVIVNVILVPLQLCIGVNGAPTADAGILVHDGDHITMLGFDNPISGKDGNVADLMIILSLNVYTAQGFKDNTDIFSSNASIGNTIHKQHMFTAMDSSGDLVGTNHINQTVCLAMKGNVLMLGRTRLMTFDQRQDLANVGGRQVGALRFCPGTLL
jgi:hypothetical protein